MAKKPSCRPRFCCAPLNNGNPMGARVRLERAWNNMPREEQDAFLRRAEAIV